MNKIISLTLVLVFFGIVLTNHAQAASCLQNSAMSTKAIQSIVDNMQETTNPESNEVVYDMWDVVPYEWFGGLWDSDYSSARALNDRLIKIYNDLGCHPDFKVTGAGDRLSTNYFIMGKVSCPAKHDVKIFPVGVKTIPNHSHSFITGGYTHVIVDGQYK